MPSTSLIDVPTNINNGYQMDILSLILICLIRWRLRQSFLDFLEKLNISYLIPLTKPNKELSGYFVKKHLAREPGTTDEYINNLLDKEVQLECMCKYHIKQLRSIVHTQLGDHE
jgi:hypothetical protein